MAKIKIPSQLRPQTDGLDQVEIIANTVGEALNKLVEKHPAIKDRIYDENNKLRRYVNIYLGDEDIRFLENLDTKVEAASELSLVPAIAGGNNICD
ncbi:MAG: MoaD/ThiS family protein [Spirochaetia bacterium]|nr:MoaD/ThiS family protein [Spirochaetia bacterium]